MSHKRTAEQIVAQFKSDGVHPSIRDALSDARILHEAKNIVPFSLLSATRMCAVINAVLNLGDVPGDTAEIGCNSGGTSRLIALLNNGRKHWACDTFSGLVDVGTIDGNLIANGDFTNRLTNFRDVSRRLSDLNVVISAGYFPDDAPQEMIDNKYALVHIDVDTYKSIRSCFAFFLERMSRGGIMIIDDVIGRGTEGGRTAWFEILSSVPLGFTVIEKNNPQVIVRVN